MKVHKKNQTIVVAGGTGNVGGFIVRTLLERGATVAVPSRSKSKISDLKEYLSEHLDANDLARLHTVLGTVSDKVEGPEVLAEITREVTAPDGVVALMGSLRLADSLLEASDEDLDHVLEHYLKAHFGTARTFLPGLRERGGTYVFVNGPLAFEVWPGSGLVSIATAAQHMLFEALAKEHEGSAVRIAELVSHAFIRDRQTQPNSPLPGEAVGAYAAYLLSEASGEIHGESLHLRSLEELEELGVSVSVAGGVAR